MIIAAITGYAIAIDTNPNSLFIWGCARTPTPINDLATKKVALKSPIVFVGTDDSDLFGISIFEISNDDDILDLFSSVSIPIYYIFKSS